MNYFNALRKGSAGSIQAIGEVVAPPNPVKSAVQIMLQSLINMQKNNYTANGQIEVVMLEEPNNKVVREDLPIQLLRKPSNNN